MVRFTLERCEVGRYDNDVSKLGARHPRSEPHSYRFTPQLLGNSFITAPAGGDGPRRPHPNLAIGRRGYDALRMLL